MDIIGKIIGIKYEVLLSNDLQEISINEFDINESPVVCLLNDNGHTFAISKWVSPKRTRSYPFERVYNTLRFSKKITVIPIVKDEGEAGDRDYIQWDTISLMSLLDVYVIFAYYDKAEKNPTNILKITNQQFNNEYVFSKIREIKQYHSSALHWNLNELNATFHEVIDKVKKSYIEIEKSTGVKLHNFNGLDDFKSKINKDASAFMDFSRNKAEKAQSRELLTRQPKENLSTLSKARITINNYLGGKYFFTVDETLLSGNKIYLMEGKHSENDLLPKIGDIKDGLLKMILYSNLMEVTVNGNKVDSEAILSLTSSKLQGAITSLDTANEIDLFFKENNFSTSQVQLIKTLIKEATKNKFIVKIQSF